MVCTFIREYTTLVGAFVMSAATDDHYITSGAGPLPERGPGCACAAVRSRGVGRDEHGAVAGELAVRLFAERDGGAHVRLLHHHRLQRQERPGAAARLADHAKKCRRLHWT